MLSLETIFIREEVANTKLVWGYVTDMEMGFGHKIP